jgi:transposase
MPFDDKGYMSPQILEIDKTLFDLRQQVNYWQSMHARAVNREALWKKKAQELEAVVRGQAVQLQEQAEQLESLTAKVCWLQQQVFGQKSEQKQSPASSADGEESLGQPVDASPCGEVSPRSRGQQPGTAGHGRKRRETLPVEEVRHPLPESACRCPECGAPFSVFPGTEDSEEIHWEVKLVRRIHQRVRYRSTCQCGALPGIITAPPAAKLIPKGLFSTGFWVQLLLEKFLFQRPLHRIRQVLSLHGLSVSGGTLSGGLKRLGEVIQPLYVKILEQSRSANRWKMDETRWLVFAEVNGKIGYRWWLWVVVTQDTCVYILDPSRSADVPKNHLGEEAEGILNADRYKAYQALGKKIQIAFCWSHIRRDFVRIHDGYKTLQPWATTWIERIDELFHKNQERLQQKPNSEAFGQKDQAIRETVAAMAQMRDQELDDPTLHDASRKALESLRNHWAGAILFVDHPEVPMDNNESERCLRNPVIGRKNYYGSGSVWSGALTAALFTLFQTLLKNHIDPQQFLLAYFDACAQNGGKTPENLEDFLPWNLSEDQKLDWAYPDTPP